MSKCLPEEEVQEYLSKILYPGVKAVLDNAITPIKEHAEQGIQPSPDCQDVCQEETVEARLARLATTNVTDWKQEQKEDPVLYQVVKHLRVPCEMFKAALHKVLDKKATAAYVKVKDQLLIKNGLLYCKIWQGPADEIVFQFIVPQRHWSTTLDGCHREAAHQGQRRSTTLMQEHFWWPGMTRDLRNCIKKCGCCRKYEAAPPIVPMKPLTCSRPGELLHVDFTSIEETVPLKEEPVIWNVLVLQDHFSKYVVAYVVKDQTARTATETLRNRYFGLFSAPAYLISDQGKAFMGHIITRLCDLYGVQKLRTLPYHAQTNGQVERMNQMIIRMIGKLEEDKKACWSEHLPELLLAYNATCSTVTGYSPYYLLFGRRSRIPVDYLFPTLHDDRQKPKYRILHRNCLLLVTNEDASDIPGQAQAEVTPTVSNATPEAFSAGVSLLERLQPSLVTQQGDELTSQVWLNGKFCTKPLIQTVPGAIQSPLDLIEDEVSDPESALSDSEPEGT